MKILVVDDNALERQIIERPLSTIEGYEVIALDNVKAAKKVLKNDQSVRFVITDWVMPDIDGLSFVRWIRRAKKLTGYVYVILLTSREDADDIERGLNAGADDYIKKPCHPKELLARVAVGKRILNLEENLRKLTESLKLQILVDDLTTLKNRRAIYETGREEIGRAHRDQTPLSVLFLDIDKFKHINDTYGHLAGDEALKLTAQLLQKNIREGDRVGRWAGDEFIALLPNTNVKEAAALGERVLQAFNHKAMLLTNGSQIILKVSIGMHTWLAGEAKLPDLDMLVKLADEAMYKAKQSGGNQTLA
jgi:two-component system cell cycle response regulator